MPKMVPVSVVTMDAQLDFALKSNASGRQLLSQVCTALGLREMWYFGLQYMDHKNRLTWVKTTKKIPASQKTKDTLQFSFKVKYYPEEVSEELIEEITRLYFYYDVKENIVSGKIYCPADTALLLASYQALIRHGKFDPNVHTTGFLKVNRYLSQNVREQYNLTDEEWEAKIVKCHISHGDLSKEDAIMEYLKIAQDLEMFGVTYFKIKNAKQTDLWLGVDALGLNVYECDNQLTPKVSFPWNEIQKLSYSRNKFSVKPAEASGKALTFYTDSTHTCKLILNLSTGNHKLYAIRRQPDSIEVQQMKVKAKERQNTREAEREKLRAEREAREMVEKRFREMERLMQENEETYARTQSVLEQYEAKVSELNLQLEEEKQSRQQLEDLQRHLEETNRQLEMESAQSLEERQRLERQHDSISAEILHQQQLLQQREEEKRIFEAELARVRAEHEEAMKRYNGDKKDSDERELQVVDAMDDEFRQSKADTDQDHATRLKLLRQDLNAVRNRQKMQAVDIHYEDNVNKGMDKYRTLRAIREGNTKKRVDQFESM